ncbi:MAG: hypothetical protein NTX25_06550 [Proteobacteria bacterium]|nr:hypothetical protein [Pseudomonadota bacterium]
MTKILALSILSLSLVTACSWGTGKLKSDWDALHDADKLSCTEIPMHKDDLRIDSIHVIPDLGPSLLLEVTTRRGVKSLYHLAFNSLSGMNEESLVPLPLNQESSFLGAGIWQQKAVFILKTVDRGKAVIQLRDLQNNAVLQQFNADTRSPWEITDWQLINGKLRSLIREYKEQESLDDQPQLQLEVQLDGKDPSKPRAEQASQVIGQAQVLLDAQNNSHIIWLSPIESWAFIEGTVDNLLSYIKGDTLLGANNSIELFRLAKTSPFSVLQKMSLALPRVHVAKPLLSSSPKANYLLLPQWLDHELTIGVYKIEATEMTQMGFRGVFKEGTSFYAAFYHEPSRENLLLMKAPGNWTSRYSLCHSMSSAILKAFSVFAMRRCRAYTSVVILTFLPTLLL